MEKAGALLSSMGDKQPDTAKPHSMDAPPPGAKAKAPRAAPAAQELAAKRLKVLVDVAASHRDKAQNRYESEDQQ